jgi:hypothetical protein
MSSASALTSSLAGAPAQTLQAARARRSAETASTAAIQRVGDLIEIHLRSVEEGTDENSAAQLRIDPNSQQQQNQQRQSRSSNNSRQRNANPQNQQQSPRQQPSTTSAAAAESANPIAPTPGMAPGITPSLTPAISTGPGTEDHPAALYKHLDIRA